jgi:hypothetical protein
VPEYWRCTACGGGAFFDEAGVVEDEHSAELVRDVCLQVVADVVGFPGGAVQQPLQAVGGVVASVFGELPAVLAADRAKQGAYVVTHATSQAGAAETMADAQEEVVEFTVPGHVRKVVDHAERLSSSPLGQFSMPLVGGAVRQDRP